MPEPLELAAITQRLAEARQAFAHDVDVLLTELRTFSDALGDAIGECGREDALRALRRVVLEKFDQRLTRVSGDDLVRLISLVRDAARLLNETDDLGWSADVDDWQRAAAPFLSGGGSTIDA
jgi:hypothetical protein